jgi:perosamine synthetase
MARIAIYEPELTEDDARAAAEAVRSGWVAEGPAVGAFEQAWAQRTDMPHAIAVSSGTAALDLAVRALGIGAGDEVICPAFAIVSCVRAVVVAGATPVLVDADPRTFNLDAGAVSARVGPRTRALLAVHTYGHPFDPALPVIARRHGIALIEDAAEAHGAEVEIDGALRPCGGIGDVSVFSFYSNKVVTTGEGGMVLARDERVAARVRASKNLCFGAGYDRHRHEQLGANFRLGNVAAAIGLSQFSRLDAIVARKRSLGARYRERLASTHGARLQLHLAGTKPIDWMIAVVLADRDARDVAASLSEDGIDTRPFFTGAHEQPVFRDLLGHEQHPVTTELTRRGLLLPSSPKLDDEAIDRVARALERALDRR